MSDCSFEELIPLIYVRYSGPSETTCLAVFGLETGMKRYGISQIRSQFTAHRTRPRQHTGKGPTCTKSFRMWNILCIPRETTWCGDVVVYGAKNSAFRRETGLSQHRQCNKIMANGRCFTVVSTIAECWHIKFRHVRCVQYVENRQELVNLSANRRVEAG